MVNALRELGLNAEASGRNDILIDGKKVSGTAQRLLNERMLHHGTLLFDSDLETVAGALRVDPEKFRSKHTKSVRSRVGNIRPLLKTDMTLPRFKEYLKSALTGHGFVEETLPAEALEEIERLHLTKYVTEDWNWGSPISSALISKRWFAGGCLEIHAEIVRNTLHSVQFFGDYLSLCPQDELAAALEDCVYTPEAVKTVLERFDLFRLFGGITQEEILDTLFCRE